MLTGDEIMIYIQLFLSFVQIGLFSVGGGYAAIPLIQSQVVETHGWLTMNEFTNLITIAEMTPGPIGANSATFTGLQIAGIPGALAATFGSIFPSCILVSILALVYCRRNFSNDSIFEFAACRCCTDYCCRIFYVSDRCSFRQSLTHFFSKCIRSSSFYCSLYCS